MCHVVVSVVWGPGSRQIVMNVYTLYKNVKTKKKFLYSSVIFMYCVISIRIYVSVFYKPSIVCAPGVKILLILAKLLTQ